MGGLVAFEEGWRLLSLRCPHGESALIHIVLAAVAVSVAMLGPGAWSVDARLFGRKRFVVDRTRGNKTSP